MSDEKQIELPDIPTEFGGPVTKWAQFQASENMRLNHDLRDKAVSMIGEEEVRRRYPTAFMTDEEVRDFKG